MRDFFTVKARFLSSWALWRFAAIGSVAALAIFFQWSERAGELILPAEHIATDAARQLLASDIPETRVLVVDIDEASLSLGGAWPWSRDRIADLVERLLVVYEAKAVGLDIIFPSPSMDSQAGDLRLAALGQYAPVVFSQAFDFTPRDPPLRTGMPVFNHFAVPLSGTPLSATGFVANHTGLSQSRCVGNIGISPDADGRIRRIPLEVAWMGHQSPLLPLAMLGCATTAKSMQKSVQYLSHFSNLNAASWVVPYARQWSSYSVVSAWDVLSGEAPEGLFKGRWVLVGSSALGLNDRAATPLSSSTAGVMVHAAVLTSLLDMEEGRGPVKYVDGRLLASFWSLITLLLLGWAISYLRAWIILPAIFTLAAAWLVLALWWLQYHLQFSIISPLLAYGAVMLMIPLEWWLLQREQGQILRSFATYVAPSVLQQMLRQGIEHPLAPQYAEITVVSADMQNYTGLTSESSLQDAAALTREFLQCLTEPVLLLGGTLDKYTGDGLVAFWGAPLPSTDHAERAIEAGKRMVLGVRQWNMARVRRGLPPARVRVGVETGAVLVGDLGTKFRSTYTAVGDCINLASKLQAIARNLNTDLIIGPMAAQVAVSGHGLVYIGAERLPGKAEPVLLWTIQDLPSSIYFPMLPDLPVNTPSS